MKRAREGAAGCVRWLRPEYQNPTGQTASGKTKEMDLGAAPVAAGPMPWPKSLPDQIAAVRKALGELREAIVAEIALQFKGVGEKHVLPLLESLVALGQAGLMDNGK